MIAASPVQIKECTFSKVHVETHAPDLDHEFELPFNFDGVDLEQYTHLIPFDEKTREYGVLVKVKVANLNGKLCPYTMDLQALGVLQVHKDFKTEELDELLVRLGFNYVYSTMREVIFGLTARGPYGPMTMPTLTYMSDKVEKKAQKPAVVKKTRVTKTTPKK